MSESKQQRRKGAGMSKPLPGDWRSGAYGGNRRAHLFQFGIGQIHKSPACGARDTGKYLPRPTIAADACRDCLSLARTIGLSLGRTLP